MLARNRGVQQNKPGSTESTKTTERSSIVGNLVRFKGTNTSFDDTELREVRAFLHAEFDSVEVAPSVGKDIADRFYDIRDQILSLVDACTDDQDLDSHFWYKLNLLSAEFGKLTFETIGKTQIQNELRTGRDAGKITEVGK